MINKKEAIKFGWNAFKKNWPPFVLLAIVYVIVNHIPRLFLDKSIPFFSPADIVGLLGGAVVGLAFTTLSLKVVDGKKVSFPDIFSSPGLLLRFVLVSVVYTVLTTIGFLLLVVPGIIILTRFIFAGYYVVDKNASFIDAFKKSWAVTRGKTIKLIFFQIYLLALLILGVITLGVGLLIAIPVISIALAYVYRKITS